MTNNNNMMLFDIGSFYSHAGTSADDDPIYSIYTRTIADNQALEINSKE